MPLKDACASDEILLEVQGRAKGTSFEVVQTLHRHNLWINSNGGLILFHAHDTGRGSSTVRQPAVLPLTCGPVGNLAHMSAAQRHLVHGRGAVCGPGRARPHCVPAAPRPASLLRAGRCCSPSSLSSRRMVAVHCLRWRSMAAAAAR